MEGGPNSTDIAVLLSLLDAKGVGPATAIARAESGIDQGEIDQALLQQKRAELDALQEAGVRAVGYFDEQFPRRLRKIPSPPAVLYIRGDLPDESQPAVAVIGTREPTMFGRTAAEALTAAAAAEGLAIISGLALGVDAIAHEAALRSGARTVAILGSGLGNVTPRQNRGLAERILAAGGALISEQPHSSASSPRSLVSRNRLQAGLSDALLVCQTGLAGGSLHTVRFAAEQGKPVWAAEPKAASDASEGNRALIGRPARDLPGLLDAWRGKEKLAERSGGGEPLARAVNSDNLEAWAKGLLLEPPSRSEDDDRDSLF